MANTTKPEQTHIKVTQDSRTVFCCKVPFRGTQIIHRFSDRSSADRFAQIAAKSLDLNVATGHQPVRRQCGSIAS
jgi:hypothetical protein